MNHRIRLAGPWEWFALNEQRQPVGEPARCQLPLTPAIDQLDSGVVLTRRFHCPTGISEATKMWIVLQASHRPVDVRLNGKTLPCDDSSVESEFYFSLTGRVDAFNQLSVLLPSQTDTAATLQNAWLEIRD